MRALLRENKGVSQRFVIFITYLIDNFMIEIDVAIFDGKKK